MPRTSLWSPPARYNNTISGIIILYPCQACLDRHLLERVDGAGTRFYPGPGNKVDIHSFIIHLIYSSLSFIDCPQVFEVKLELPPGLTCVQCVLQWRYVAANNWGENLLS